MKEKSLLKLLQEEDKLVEEANDIVREKEGKYNIIKMLEKDKEYTEIKYKDNVQFVAFLCAYVKEQDKLIAKHMGEIPSIERKEKDVRTMLASVRQEISRHILQCSEMRDTI